LKAAMDLCPFFIGCKKNAAKEITESFSAYTNCLEHIGEMNDDWVVASVGDGKRPRTASVFRFLTRANQVLSIDPALDLNWIEKDLPEIYNVRPRGMTYFKNKVENIEAPECIKGRNLLIVGVHSHGGVLDSIKKLGPGAKSISVFWMPCCRAIDPKMFDKDIILGCDKFVTFNDPEIWSAKNQIYLWKNVQVLKPKAT
jgi:hypothetical protein